MKREKIGNLLYKFKRKQKIPRTEYQLFGETPIVDQSSDTLVVGYTDNPDARHEEPLPITVFGDHTRQVKYVDFPFASGADGTQLLYPNTPEIHPTFFYYAVKNIDLSNYFYARHFKFLKDQFIIFPDLGTQQRIASILSSCDYLIENNRRRMALLEEAARQLYKEWFVRLRFPGWEHTKIKNGVPGGWEKVKVGNLLMKIKSKTKIKKDDYSLEGPIPCVDQSASFIGGYTDDEGAEYSSPLPIIVFGDHTRVLKFVNFPFARGADGTQLIYPNTERITVEFMYCALVAIDLSNYFYARHFKFLKEQELLIPTSALVREFTNFVGANFEMIKTLRDQNRKLQEGRDLLLPRLMSGQIAV